MGIAVLIISLALALIVTMQSCAVAVGGGMTADEDLSNGGAAGLLLAFLFVLGAGFAMGLPTVSVVVFALGAVLGVVVGLSGSFGDLTIWGIASGILAVMSFFGRRELRRRNAAAVAASRA